MPTLAMASDPLFLSIMPVSLTEQRRRIEYLTEKLKKYSLEEIAEHELNTMYSLAHLKDSPRQRYYKNLFLVYSRSQLKQLLLESYSVYATPSIIKSVFPSGGVRIEEGFLSRVMVYLRAGYAALDLELCTATIDGQSLASPTLSVNGLVFLVQSPPCQGRHQLGLTLTDRTGTETRYQSEFEIIGSSSEIRDQYWRDKLANLRERLISDNTFRKLVLTDARTALAEAGLPFSRAVSSVLPPPISEDIAEFLTHVDSEVASETVGRLNQRVSAALGNRDNERIATLLERLGVSGIVAEGGGLNQSTKDTISQILQDPHRMLASIGVVPTEEENKYIFPPFPKVTADAFADWMSQLQADAAPEPSRETRARFHEMSKHVTSDSALLHDWLTNPTQTFRDLYPGATARDMLALPPSQSDENARRMLTSLTASSIPAPVNAAHNSSDLVIGFSFTLFNKLIDLYFTLEQPGLLPIVITQTNASTGLPPPYGSIQYVINIARPENLRVVDAAARLISLTGSGNATVTLADGTDYSLTLALTPKYSVEPRDTKIVLAFDSVNVQVSVLPEIINPAVNAAFTGFIEGLVREYYPRDDIYLVDQKPIELNVPFADVAIDLHRIHVHDDQDSGGSGELFFGIQIDGREYLFGQYDADSGTSIPLWDRQFRLKKGNDAISIQVRGVDRDAGVWPDQDDDLGIALNCHYRSSPGNYSLQPEAPIVRFEWVWDVLETIWKPICWLVDAINWVIDECGKLIGLKQTSWSCVQTLEQIMGLVRKAVTVMTKSYTLEYGIVALDPTPISISLSELHLAEDGLYLSFDFDIPNIEDNMAKTVAHSLTDSSDFSIAVSENLLDKIIRAWWRYSTIPRTVTTGFDERWAYAHLDFDQPQITLLTSFSDVLLQLAISGSAGADLGPLGTPRFGLPNQAFALSSLQLQQDSLRPERHQLVFRIDNIVTGGAPILEQVMLHCLGTFSYSAKPEADKVALVMDLSQHLRASVTTSDFSLNPLALKVSDDEIIMSFTTQIAPILRVDPYKLDYTVGTEKVVTLSNDGNAMLTVTGISVDDMFFLMRLPFPAPSEYSPLNILPKQVATVAVSIDPMWTGEHRGMLRVESNDPVRPTLDIPLIALDIPRIDVAAEQQFGGWQAFRDREYERLHFEATLEIRSTGHAPLTIEAMAIYNNAFQFNEKPVMPFTIPPQGNRRVQMTCDTRGIRYRDTDIHYGVSQSGDLVVTSDDPMTPTVSVILTLERPVPFDGEAPGTGDEGWYERTHAYDDIYTEGDNAVSS